MQIRPEIALTEQRIVRSLLETRCLQLAQQLADVTNERDQALADRDAIRAERDELLMERNVDGERHGSAE
ncbi:hypothetical protein J2046_003016 [Rhizobium petrolearium]|uniref:hypothetical protein n=1 Tax=Neorhizobium petrolearium TaxID=515361 RepID=UPI001AE4D8F7|nr:hypothetical protein [Neorhizobium petrolearium]MBP1844749.1 hypothetical protein [Neorhizobium petrolearium]